MQLIWDRWVRERRIEQQIATEFNSLFIEKINRLKADINNDDVKDPLSRNGRQEC